MAHLNKTFSFLLPKQDDIEPWILENQQYFWAFFAGYSDAEGSLHSNKNNIKPPKSFMLFELNSYDKNILCHFCENLRKSDIYAPLPRISHPKGAPCGNKNYFSNNDTWRLTISRKDSLWKLIHFWEKYSKHKDKQAAIKKAKENIILRNQLPHCHKIDLSTPNISNYT